jgi:hypothetical protein
VNGASRNRLTLLKMRKEGLKEGGPKREVQPKKEDRTNNDHLGVLVSKGEEVKNRVLFHGGKIR